MLGAKRGLAIGPDELMVTRGSQMALDLCAQVLLEPGAAVAVEDPGYPPAWRSFRARGAELVGLPVDAEGVSIEALEQACKTRPLRAVYLTPHHQYPTAVTMSAARRLRLHDFVRDVGGVALPPEAWGIHDDRGRLLDNLNTKEDYENAVAALDEGDTGE